MTLQDFVRECTRDENEILKHHFDKRKDLLSSRAAADERRKRITTEIAKGRSQVAERKKDLDEKENNIFNINQELDAIERKRAELLESLISEQNENERAKETLRTAEDEANKQQKEENKERNFFEETCRQVQELEKSINEHEVALKGSYVRSLDHYLVDLRNKIDQSFLGQEEVRLKIESLNSLKRARHEDPVISDLCEQRDEWQKMLNGISVPAVKISVENELEKITQELEKRFPGALQIDPVPEVTDAIEELYYFQESDKSVILLPIEKNTWNSIEKGEHSVKEETALKIIWCFANAARNDPKEEPCEIVGNWCGFNTSVSPENLEVSIPLPGSGKIQFVLMSLPNDIQEAMFNESQHA